MGWNYNLFVQDDPPERLQEGCIMCDVSDNDKQMQQLALKPLLLLTTIDKLSFIKTFTTKHVWRPRNKRSVSFIRRKNS